MKLALLKIADKNRRPQLVRIGGPTDPMPVDQASVGGGIAGVAVGSAMLAAVATALLAGLIIDYFRLRDGTRDERLAIVGGYLAGLAGFGAARAGSAQLAEVLGLIGAGADGWAAWQQYGRDVHPILNILSGGGDAIQIGAGVSALVTGKNPKAALLTAAQQNIAELYATSNDMQAAAGPESDELDPTADPFAMPQLYGPR